MAKRAKDAVAKGSRTQNTETVKLECVSLDARRLITIGPEDAFWKTGVVVAPDGAIVRVRPPAQATDDQIANLKKLLEKSATVRFDSRAAADAIIHPPQEMMSMRADARQTCMEMAETSSRRDELKQLLDAELTKVRL